MIFEIGRHRISPHPNGLCWQLHELRTVRGAGGGREEWVAMGRYPSDLASALSQCLEFELRGMSGEEAAGWREALAAIGSLFAEAARIGRGVRP